MTYYWGHFQTLSNLQFDDEEIKLLALERLACMMQELQY